MSVSIRRAKESDLKNILDLVNFAIAHTTANYSYEPQTSNDQLIWFNQKSEKNFPVLIAESDGEFAGFSTYGTFREKIGYRFTMEHSVYVKDDFHGKGIGKKLMLELISAAKNNGIHSLIGAIDADNSASIEFHEKLGFQKCGIIKKSAWKFDRWLDLLFMQLILDQP